MQQETPDEFVGGQGHHLDLIAIAIVLPLEADLMVLDIQQAVVGNGDAVSVASYVIEDLLGSGDRRLGVHDPLTAVQSVQEVNQGRPVPQGFQGSEEL